MHFFDKDLEKIKFSEDILNQDIYNFAELFIRYLCGYIQYTKTIIENHKHELAKLLSHVITKGLNHALFNEILLLLNQNRVSEDFYKFFFLKNEKGDINKEIDIKQLKEGITRFRGFCLLHFGNIIYTFQSLSKASFKKINSIDGDFYKEQEIGRAHV